MKFPPTSDIRRIRKSLDVTQTALAAQSGVSQSTIAKIERGRISASYETVVKLFTALDDLAAHGPRRDLTAAEVASRDVVTVQIPQSRVATRAHADGRIPTVAGTERRSAVVESPSGNLSCVRTAPHGLSEGHSGGQRHGVVSVSRRSTPVST